MSAAAPSSLLRGVYGGIAYGLVVAAISHPFDTLKCQRQAGSPAVSADTALLRLRQLYRGVGPATAASIALRTVPFVGYEAVTSAFHKRHLLEDAPLLVAFVGGLAGGVMRGFLETPSEVIKTQQQLGIKWSLASLLRGLSSTCLRNQSVLGVS